MSEEADQDQVKVVTQHSNLISFGIYGYISANPADYTERLHALRTAGENDVVNIFINSYGGCVDTAIEIMDAIKSCSAPVIGNLVGQASSAASMIFLSCDGFYVAPMATMMVHTATYGSYGKGHESADCINFYAKVIENNVRDIYEGFLTEEELDDVLNKNKDLYFSHEDLLPRLEYFAEYKMNKELESLDEDEDYED